MRWVDVPAPVKRKLLDEMMSVVTAARAGVFSGATPASVDEVIEVHLAAISELERVPVHVRTGPGMDVAACSERGTQLRFAMGQAGITCPTCKEKRTDPAKAAAQGNKLRKVHGAMNLHARSGLASKDGR